jgi:tetratricopeptide (TPR) repeat protein
MVLFSAFGQEKRLALVIGNANYDKGALKNPVNDALLMKETLEKLNFEVILDTNLRTRTDLLNCINLFGEKRKNYSVGFVYYAGHGVQIDGGNYILATKEKYDSKINVKDNGVNVDRFLEYFELAKNEINILILDACRNNPFEKNWSTSSRSLEDGLGLAPLTSSGNIIAFSTSAGTTASDGNEKAKNSSYCLSLAKNMLTTDLDLDQIFRNVRKEVREISGGNQLPTVDNHYEGSNFYFRKSTFTDQIIQIDSLIDAKDYVLALEKVTEVLTKSPNFKQALLRRGRIEYNLKNKDYNGSHLFKADSLYPNDPQVYEYLGRYYSAIGEVEKAIQSMNKAINLDSQDPELFYWRARFFEETNEVRKAEIDYTQSLVLDSTIDRFFNRASFYERTNNYEKALDDYSQAISYEKENPSWYNERANCYIAKGDFTAALKDLDKAIELAPNDPRYYNNRADFYLKYMKKYELALKDYAAALKLSKDPAESSRTLNNRAVIYGEQEKFELALADYSKAIEIYPNDPLIYSNRAGIYKKQQNYELALADYIQAISIDKENPSWYNERANCYIAKEDFTAALKDLDKAIDLAPNDPRYYNNRADFYREQDKYEQSLKDYATALKLSKDPYQSARALNNRALIYRDQEKFDLALEEYTKAIEIYPNHSLYYSNRAEIYQKQENYELALKDYSQAISFDKGNPRWYEERANCYIAKGDFTAALKDLDKAIDLTPNDPIYYNNRADYYSNFKKEVELALKDYESALKLSKDSYQSARALNNRALIYRDQEKFDLALVEYTKALEIYPNHSLYYSNRAEIYQKQENYELALKDYSQAILVDKDNPSWYNERANCYIAKGDFSAALKDLDKAIDLAPDDPSYYNNRAYFYKNYMKEDSLALKDYVAALGIYTNDYETSRSLIGRGLIFENQGEFELAIEDFTKAIDKIPEEPDYYSKRANVYQKQGKFGQAEDDYTQAIVLDPKNEKWYFNRSFFFSKKQDLKNAIEDISKAIELNPNDADYYYFLGTYFLSVKNRDDALKILKKGLEISPSDIDIISEIGDMYLEDGKFDLAIQMYDQVITSDKTDPQSAAYCYDGRGEIYFEQGKYEMALADYTKAIDLEPESYRYASRADVYQILERPYDALLDYTFAISLDSMQTYLWWGRGKLFSDELNNNEMAILDFEQILKMDPNNINALNWRTIFYHRNNEISAAIEGYKKIIKMGDSIKKLEKTIEDYGWANINLAEIYQCENKLEEASRLFNEGVTYMPNYPKGYYWRAWFSALYMSKYDDAISDFSSSIKLEPTNPYWYLNRSKIYQLKGELKKAKNDIDDAVKASKESAIYLTERGNFYSQIGEYEKANNDFQNAFKIDSKHRRLYHYIAEDLIQQGKSDEAIESLRYAISVFDNDTVSFEQLGRIYFAKNEWQKSLSFYSQAASIMEFNDGYRTIYPHDIQVFLSDVYLKISEIYKKLNQTELECDVLQKAEKIVIFETRPDRQKLIKEIKEKLKNCQN